MRSPLNASGTAIRWAALAAGLAAIGLVTSACGSASTSTAASTRSLSTSSAPAISSSGPATSGGPATSAGPAGPAGASKMLADAKTGKLVIGIKFDQPGLALKNPDGSFSGFDVQVATYVAQQLGVAPAGIEFKEAKSAEREGLIERGEVDFIVATYSITDNRKQKVGFGGPYFVAHQDLLVKAENTDITGPEAMTGKILCSVTGSTSAQKVKDTYAKDVALQEFGTYAECVEAMKTGVVDAVTTDDVILAGFAAQSPGEFRLVGKGFTDEKYGIGVKKGDTTGTATVNSAITKMISDGSWRKALESTVGPSGYKIPAAPTVG